MSQRRTAVLTGAAGAIGVVTARRLIDDGATVYGVDIDETALDAAAVGLGAHFVPVVGDLGSSRRSDPSESWSTTSAY